MARTSRNAAGVKQGSRTIPGCRRSTKCKSTYACRKAVYNSMDPTLRAGKLHKRHLTKNRAGKIVSRKKSHTEKKKYATDPNHPLRRRNDIVDVVEREMQNAYSPDGTANDAYDGFDDRGEDSDFEEDDGDWGGDAEWRADTSSPAPSYVPFSQRPAAPARSPSPTMGRGKRAKKGIPAGAYSFHGSDPK